MKKKIFISILSFIAIIAGFLCPQSASALTTPDGEKAFTVGELMSLGNEFEKELRMTCGADYECRQELLFTRIENDGRYRALDNFYQTLFFVTSINPAENTMKVFYHSKNGMLRWFEDDLPEEKLTELQIGWSEPGTKKPVVIYGYIPTDEPLVPEGFHFIYSGSVDEYEAGWIPADTEFVVDSPNFNLSLITDGLIQAAFYTEYSNSTGWTDVSDCLNSPYYEVGVECKAVFTEQSLLTFVPFKDGAPAYDAALPEPGPEEEGNQEIISPVIVVKETDDIMVTNNAPVDDNFKSEVDSINESSIYEQGNEEPLLDDNFMIPLGGENEVTSNSCSCYDEFPWWFIVVVIACDIVIMWLFYPKRKES